MFLGSGIGGWCRYRAGLHLNLAGPSTTLVVNLVGSFILGFLFARVGADLENNQWLFLGIGLCGGLTTMSTFCLENIRLLQQSTPVAAALYIAATLAGCLGSCWLGVRMGG